jgi:hypothetical protein
VLHDVCRWLPPILMTSAMMSTANDFWRERKGGNFWSRWLSFSRRHIWIQMY